MIFTGNYIDRQSILRSNPRAVADALNQRDSRYIVIWQDQCLIHEDRVALLPVEAMADFHDPDHVPALLGTINDQPIFTLSLTGTATPCADADHAFAGLRDISNRLAPDQAGLAAYAKAVVGWQRTHRFCGVCGTRNEAREAGFSMVCSNQACGHKSFPRLDPAIIVLVTNGDEALLGRQLKWPDGRFSTIAGFVEPGESLEDALRREVHEETNIRVGSTNYIASQPWPFPASLMIGFHAEAQSTDIQLNDGELAEARWITRKNIIDGDIVLPPDYSVAWHLVKTWFDEHDGPSLADIE
ncbi:MAG: NAD(+) diphosphatase [Gammaproteobacteria bacterium]|nr:NAD(+) diphosphatase [Gammaproteobacteria bacterium]